MQQELDAVEAFLPRHSSAYGGVGYESEASVLAYQSSRLAALAFARRQPDSGDVAVISRNTTEAVNHLAYRLGLSRGDVVVTTVAEHDSNRLPWARAATCRCGTVRGSGTAPLARARTRNGAMLRLQANPGEQMSGAGRAHDHRRHRTLVDVVQEPVFGPVMMFGLDGIAADGLADDVARLAPGPPPATTAKPGGTALSGPTLGYGVTAGPRISVPARLGPRA